MRYTDGRCGMSTALLILNEDMPYLVDSFVMALRRQRVVASGVLMTEDLYARLVPWVERHYRDRVEPKDLADPQLAIECSAALADLERILGLPGLYDLS
jgi:succinylarginine dihydrolase